MSRTGPTRRLFVAGAAATSLAACVRRAPDLPANFEPYDFDYLTKLRLNVARVDIDDSWTPPAGPRQVGFLAPTSPLDALRLMAQQRLVPAGPSGRAVFVIEEASIAVQGGRHLGTFAVRLDVVAGDGQRTGFAEAQVTRTAQAPEGGPNATRAALDALERQMMSDMNVELEFQVRRSLRDVLLPDATTTPAPGAVQVQELGPVGSPAPVPPPPPSVDAAPTPLVPQTYQPAFVPPSLPASPGYASPGYAQPGYAQPGYPPPVSAPDRLPPGTYPLRPPTPLYP